MNRKTDKKTGEPGTITQQTVNTHRAVLLRIIRPTKTRHNKGLLMKIPIIYIKSFFLYALKCKKNETGVM
jgi:hypothetical protein